MVPMIRNNCSAIKMYSFGKTVCHNYYYTISFILELNEISKFLCRVRTCIFRIERKKTQQNINCKLIEMNEV